ncbi:MULTISPECIES: formylglycine-generating enzyme family protein [Chryseobacterium]|uniref:Formylglycine-generating enzyme family protein n=3 Tax=Chryseobacterium TaxID=59732 RepID=A0A3G6N136_9FLAO|nr:MULTISPECIES: formylglycine-generating enzyme family protein [Chryseobacterium]AZA60148.1 formylglycine-generating enzyme family protein [Chryseobacterium indoltheticum]MCD0477862.1 formylglycine-generating enzyme family protein [Chryseobacterium sp. LC2016-29]SFZ93190.1 Formylglycine-generating enzyme, required for sulfatase activity, contains SUMF1/FGE domain [Chryseobacterium limigenitum]
MRIVVSMFFAIAVTLFSCSRHSNMHEKSPDVHSHLKYVSNSKKMVRIDGGVYEAFIGKDSGRTVKVETFYLDDSPVTNADYLRFLKANPQWTKSKVKRLYADSSYLQHWKSDYEIPENLSPDAPVTNVSWYAAKEYARSVGKRLPTIDEWEFTALADRNSKNASKKPEFTDYILKSYQKKDKNKQVIKQDLPNYYGVYDMYGMVWEWTFDFNSVMMSGESRKDNTTNESLFCAGAAITSSDLRNYAGFVRYALRGSLKADYCLNNLGFRCAKNLNK